MFPRPDSHFRFVFAPMEGVTDAPMRELYSQFGPWDWAVTEFIRVTELPVPDHVFYRRVPELKNGGKTPSGLPVAVQLLGGNAELLAQSAELAVKLGAPAIDLNFGCPAPTVNRHDGGATLLKHPHRIYEIVSTVRARVPSHIPVSAKVRLGWENPSDVLLNAEQVYKAGADWITVHARTRMAGYQPPVFWDWIGRVVETVKIPVIANGDLWTVDDILTCRKMTGCQTFMLGRGALADPLLVKKAKAALLEQVVETVPGAELPRNWSLWFRGLESLVGDHPRKSELVTARCKQWGNYANRVRKNDWFDKIKKHRNLDDICRELGS